MQINVRNIKIVIEYDGTDYCGWQIQKNKPTVQETVQKGIKNCLGETVTVYGASRTDSGVHALGQTANFFTRSKMPAGKILNALNAHLPEDISVRQVSNVNADFHAQFDAKKKIYRYFLFIDKSRPAVNRNFCSVFRKKLDVAKMRKAIRYLLGTHDFRSFGTELGKEKNTVRTLYQMTVSKKGAYLVFTVKGNGFLYNMVRTIVGTLLLVGQGKMQPLEVQKILDARDRRKAGPPAPAKGLFLQKVIY